MLSNVTSPHALMCSKVQPSSASVTDRSVQDGQVGKLCRIEREQRLSKLPHALPFQKLSPGASCFESLMVNRVSEGTGRLHSAFYPRDASFDESCAIDVYMTSSKQIIRKQLRVDTEVILRT